MYIRPTIRPREIIVIISSINIIIIYVIVKH